MKEDLLSEQEIKDNKNSIIPILIFKYTIEIIELVFTIRLKNLIVRRAVAWVAFESSHLKIAILRWDLVSCLLLPQYHTSHPVIPEFLPLVSRKLQS